MIHEFSKLSSESEKDNCSLVTHNPSFNKCRNRTFFGMKSEWEIGHIESSYSERQRTFLPLWIRRSSSARRDTTFFLRAPRYDILQPSGEIRHSSSARWDSTFFIRTARCDVVPLSRRLAQLQNKHNIPAKDELDISVQFRVMLYINL